MARARRKRLAIWCCFRLRSKRCSKRLTSLLKKQMTPIVKSIKALRTEVETGRKSPEQASDLLALYQEQSADSRAKHVARDAGLVK